MSGRTKPRSLFWIATAAASRYGLDVPALLARDRRRHVVAARQDAMRSAYVEGYGCVAIGRFFERDHSTVLHAIRRRAR